jgi:hypothetical protein
MLSPVTVLGLLIVGLMTWLVVRLVSLALAPNQALDRRERTELEGLRGLIDDLKETAWEHRELDSALSTIVIDKIREHERRRRELG